MSLECTDITFRDRRATCLQTDSFEVVTTTASGHLASLRIPDVEVNPLWEPPWPGMEPGEFDPEKHLEIYGPGEGRLLASLAGHNLCLNHFGDLTETEEAAAADPEVGGEAQASAPAPVAGSEAPAVAPGIG